jgi:uncharacterized protein YegP (UPF0339 family)
MTTSGIIGGAGLLGGVAQMKFRIQRAKDGQFYWTAHRLTGNTEAFAISEMYTSKQSAKHSIDLLKQYAANALVEDLA